MQKNPIENTHIKAPNYAGAIGLLTSSTTYPFSWTATDDGWINIRRLVPSASGNFVTINGEILAGGSNAESHGVMFPVKKGDVCEFTNISNGYTRGTFIPNAD